MLSQSAVCAGINTDTDWVEVFEVRSITVALGRKKRKKKTQWSWTLLWRVKRLQCSGFIGTNFRRDPPPPSSGCVMWPACFKFPDLKCRDVSFSQRLVQVYQTTRRHIPEGHNPRFTLPAGSHGCRFSIQVLGLSGPGSLVGIAIGYGLGGAGIEYRWGARFTASVQTGPGAHPISCTMGTGSFPGGIWRPGCDADPSPLLVPWSWKGGATPLLPYGPYGLYRASVPVQGRTLPYFAYMV